MSMQRTNMDSFILQENQKRHDLTVQVRNENEDLRNYLSDMNEKLDSIIKQKLQSQKLPKNYSTP